MIFRSAITVFRSHCESHRFSAAFFVHFLWATHKKIVNKKNKYKIVCFIHTFDTFICYNNTALCAL